MDLETIDGGFTLCKVKDYSRIDLDSEFVFTGRTDGERSLVCRTCDVPSDVIVRDDGWRALRVCGTLDLSLIGIMAEISTILADSGIGLFAVSTFDTDYILVRSENFDKAIGALRAAGHMVDGN